MIILDKSSGHCKEKGSCDKRRMIYPFVRNYAYLICQHHQTMDIRDPSVPGVFAGRIRACVERKMNHGKMWFVFTKEGKALLCTGR